MLDLDGSEGGGQLIRSALSLSALTGEPFRMTDVRGGRSTPGLRPQHLAAVRAVAEACGADAGDPATGDRTLTFDPGRPRGGEVAVDVGTAGSVTLVCDAVLPLAAHLDERLALTVRGGTDVKWSPPLDYLRRVKLPLLRRVGLGAALDVDRRGFYPKGGGAVRLHLGPSSLSRLDLRERGPPRGVRVYSAAAEALADADVAERQARAAVEALADAGATVPERVTTYAETASPGSAVVVRADHEGALAGFDALGEPGKPADDVAAEAVADALAFRAGGAAVDEHLADQLLVFLALAGGEVRVPGTTDHVASSLSLLEAFGFDLDTGEENGTVLVRA